MPPQLLLFNCNPNNSWIRKKFYEPWQHGALPKNVYCQLADIKNNPHLTKEYLDGLKEMPPEMYKRYVEHRWDIADEINQLVQWDWVRKCEGLLNEDGKERELFLGVDVGWRGNDPTVFCVLDSHGNIVSIDRFPKSETDAVVNQVKLVSMQQNIPAENICVDSVGVGAGVISYLNRDGYDVIAFSGGGTETLKDCPYKHINFANWKSWAGWEAAEALREGRIGNFTDESLQSDAVAIKLTGADERKIKIESKESLRSRLGRSCDSWDAFTYAFWAKYRKEKLGIGGIEGLFTSSMLKGG